jgi:hypothetical protein
MGGTNFSTSFGKATQIGRGYMDPNRANERYARWDDRMARQKIAGMGGGGGSRGGGGMVPQLPFSSQPFSQQDITDAGLINFGNAPGMGQDLAQAQARASAGTANLGDFSLITQRNSPSMSPDYNNAIARQQFNAFNRRRMMQKKQGGLVSSAQEALYG